MHVAAVSFAALVCSASSLRGATRSAASVRVDTVTSVDRDAFLGRWYQMYGSISSTILTFGNAGPQDLCTSADYFANEDGSTIDVLNQGIRPDGRVTKIWGQAKATDEPGKRKLTFSKFIRGNETIQAPDFEGDYWIYKLGPMLETNLKVGKVIQTQRYAYAIVAGPAKPSYGLDKTQVFVLSRDPFGFKESYGSEVLEWLSSNGFDWWWNRPRKTGSIGSFRWFPYPVFNTGDGSRGEFGQDNCATVAELSPPSDGSSDMRV